MNIKSVPVLTEDFFDNREKALKQFNKINNQLNDRIDYIAKTIYSVFGLKLYSWRFADGKSFEEAKYVDTIQIEYQPDISNLIIIDKRKKEYCLDTDFPARWLTEFFEDELVEGRQAYIDYVEERERRAQEKTAKEREEEDRILNEIKAKLTDRELKLLKRKL